MDLGVVGPVVGTLAFLDVILHIMLDVRKTRGRLDSESQEPDQSVPSATMAAIAVSTLLAFIVVLSMSLAWLLSASVLLFLWVVPLIDVPLWIWMTGLAVLSIGILLHGWSRLARQNMASSWAMGRGHRLVQTGPYSRIRHPSYVAYMLSFFGLFLLLPSVVTVLILVGTPGYYLITRPEEEMMISRFGDEYREYTVWTGRFLPRTGRKRVVRPKQ